MGLRLGAAPPARRWGLRPALLRPVAVLILGFGVAISATLASVWQHTVSGQHADRLDRTAASRTTAVGNAIRRYQDVLMAERALVLASTFVSRADFHAFADALEFRRMYPGLQSIGWYADVPGRRLAGFLASARHDGPAGFQVTPPGRRPAYYVALYSEPGGRAGLGVRLVPGARPAGRVVPDPPGEHRNRAVRADGRVGPAARQLPGRVPRGRRRRAQRHADARRPPPAAAVRATARLPDPDRRRHQGPDGAGRRAGAERAAGRADLGAGRGARPAPHGAAAAGRAAGGQRIQDRPGGDALPRPAAAAGVGARLRPAAQRRGRPGRGRRRAEVRRQDPPRGPAAPAAAGGH